MARAAKRRLIRAPDFGIATRMALSAIVLGVVTAAAISFHMYRTSAAILTERAQQSLADAVNTATHRFSARLDSAFQDVHMLAKVPPVVDLAQLSGGETTFLNASAADLKERLARIFTALLEARPEYFQLRLLDAAPDGRETVRVERAQNGEIARTPEDKLQAKGDRPYFTETTKLLYGQVYVSDFDLNQENGKIEEPFRPVIRIATPVFGPSNRLFGIVVINVEASRLFSLVGESLGSGAVPLIANQSGDYLYAADPEWAFGFVLGKPRRIQDDLPELGGVLEGERQSVLGTVTVGSDQNLAYALRVHFDPAQRLRYVVVAALLPTGPLLATIGANRDLIIFLAGGLIIAGAAFAIGMAGAVVRPLRKLTAAANEIAEGRRNFDFWQLAERRDETGQLARALAVMVKEIGDREDRLVAQARELVRSNQELAQFAYVASHDLQEPLRMIGSYLELLTRRYGDRLDGEAAEFIGFAVDGAARMKRLINDLLGYSRAGNNPLRLEAVDLARVVDNVASTLAAQIGETHAAIEVGPLPTVRADAIQIERLFLNLIENALKYRSTAPPGIRVAAEREGGVWRITVADNGIGIDPRFKEKVFEIFKRLHGREEYSGTGIGLAVAKMVVERHGGHIRVEPNPGGGSAFIFTLPA